MRVAAAIFNLAALLFTGLVLLTDGLPAEAGSWVLLLLLVLVPTLNLAALARAGREFSSKGRTAGWAAVVGNLLLLGLLTASIPELLSHSREEGYIPYLALLASTPLLSLAALRGRLRKGRSENGTAAPGR